MQLSELKTLLTTNPDKAFRIALPNGSPVPQSFHITEVGRVQKSFIDCGGTVREVVACQLQVWVGEDIDHRIETKKAAAILEKARSLIPDDALPVEIEYEDEVISQYTVEGHEKSGDSVVLKLAHKHTECLAPELCKLPKAKADSEEGSCRAGSGCC